MVETTLKENIRSHLLSLKKGKRWDIQVFMAAFPGVSEQEIIKALNELIKENIRSQLLLLKGKGCKVQGFMAVFPWVSVSATTNALDELIGGQYVQKVCSANEFIYFKGDRKN